MNPVFTCPNDMVEMNQLTFACLVFLGITRKGIKEHNDFDKSTYSKKIHIPAKYVGQSRSLVS